MFKGTVNASMISPREIFLEALEVHAVHLVLVHNHPSGDPSPSREDVLMTEQVRQVGELLGIRLLDHIITGEHAFISLREEGLLGTT
jgi:DNA repair protein RadC